MYRIGDIREDIIDGTYDVSRKKTCAIATEEEKNKRLHIWQLKCACQVYLRGST